MKSAIMEQRGHFWWHDELIQKGDFAPNNHATGVLTIQEDGSSRLELDGELPSPDHLLTRLVRRGNSKRQERAIQGILKGTGKHVLLLDAVEDGGSFHTNRFSYERFFATRCLISDSHIPSGKIPTFSVMRVRLIGLEDWLRLGSIEVRKTKRSISVRQKTQKTMCYRMTDASCCLEHFVSGPYLEKERTHELELREFMTLILRPRKHMSSEDVRDEFHLLQDLLTLLTDSSYSIDWPTVSPVRSKERLTFYFQRQVSSSPAPKWYECPTNFMQIRSDFGKVFDEWRKKRSQYGAGFYSYLGTRRDVKLYIENEFTNLIGGIEAFHRTKFPVPEVSKKLDEKITRIINDVKLPKDRKWLSNILSKRNEPSLEQRVFEIIMDLPLDIKDSRAREFAKACADRRNEISHFMGERKQANRTDFIIDLKTKSRAIGLIYHLSILKEIGFGDDTLKNWIYSGFHSYRSKIFFAEAGLLDKEILNPQAKPAGEHLNLTGLTEIE